MALPKGGIYNPKTGSYFVGGQGYSSPTNPNIPQNPLTKAIEEKKKKKKGGGGGGSSTTTQTPIGTSTTVTTTPTVTPTPTTTPTPPSNTNVLTQEQKVLITRSGAVKEGRITYVGNAVVGDTGKTANQFQQELRQQYKKETGKAVGQGRLSGEVTYTTTTTQQEQQSPSNLLFGGSLEPSTSYGSNGTGIEVNAFGGIKEINPQGYSYQDARTGRGYEITPFRTKKLPANKLVEFNEMYYGVSDKISRVASKVSSIKIGKITIGSIFTDQLIPSATSSRVPKNKREEIAYKLYGILQPEYILASSFPASRVPKKLTIPERKLASASVSKEVAVTKIIGGKEIRVARYNLYTEVKPPRVIISRTKGGGLLGISDDLVRLPSQSIKTTTPFNVVGQKEFTTFNAKNVKYGKVLSVERVTPVESRAISLSEYSTLPKQDKFLLQRLVETRIGKPVPLKLVPRFLNEKNMYVRSSFEVEKAGRIAKVKIGEYNVLKPLGKVGRGTKRFTTISEVAETGETNLFKLYKVDTIYKDVTMPFSRAAGKTPRLITRGAELKEPIVLDVVKNVDFISPASITKTPMSKTFAEQVVRQTFAKPIPSIPRTRITPIVKTAESTYAVAGISQSSRYAGTGIYERTEGGMMPSFKLPSLISQPNIKTTTIFTTSNINLFKQEPITKSSPVNRNIFKEILLPREITTTQQKPITKTIEIQKVIQKQKVLQKQKIIQKQQIRITPRITKIIIRIPRKRKPTPFSFKFKPFKQPSRSGKLILLIKQKGIWKSQGKFSDINKATSAGKFLTGSTIDRSFKIEGGKGILPSGYRYQIRRGKPIKNVFVELSRTSISQKGEREALLSGMYYKGGKTK